MHRTEIGPITRIDSRDQMMGTSGNREVGKSGSREFAIDREKRGENHDWTE
jgi:hypothetical protein